MEGVAQLAERMPVEHEVAGSFPVALPKNKGFSTIRPPSKKKKVVLILKSHCFSSEVRNKYGTGYIVATRICTKCGLPKDDSEYTWSIRGIKKHSSCNSCRNLERMDYYDRNKDKELKYKAERQVNKREEARHFVFDYLSQSHCVDCGTTDPMVLTFDHVRGSKKMNISQMVNQGYSLDAIQKEIDKCEVRCASCHMKIEKKRRGTVYF